jgi:medium-chain acyl-[acyl-carrier-protein] hydrolase
LSDARRIDRPYRVRFDECGPEGTLPASGALRYVQDLAWVHSNERGFGREWYGPRGLTWLIRAIELELSSSAAYGETLSVSTEVAGFRRVWARRQSRLTAARDGRTIAQATIDWVLLDAAGIPTRIPAEIDAAFAPPDVSLSPLRVRLPPVASGMDVRQFAARRAELDPLAHVNNAAYFDYVDEQLAGVAGGRALTELPRLYRVEFVAPAEAGVILKSSLWQADGRWCWRLESAVGRELARATIEARAGQPNNRS